MYFLPPQYKDNLMIIKKTKIIMSLSLSLILSLVILLLLMIVAINYLNSRLSLIKLQNQSDEVLVQSYVQEGIDKKIKNMSAELSSIEQFYRKQIYIIDIYKIIENEMNNRGVVSSLSIFRIPDDKESAYQVSISGSVPTRSILGEVKSGIASYSQVPESSVQASFATWITPDNFNISFKYIKNGTEE